MAVGLLLATPSSSSAAGRRKASAKVPLDLYTQDAATGFFYYDLEEGQGRAKEEGELVKLHFDCRYRGIDAVSSRSAQLLAGNRVVSQPLELKVGDTAEDRKKKRAGDRAGGLYSGSSGPDAPPALYHMVKGMKVGGRRLVKVEGDDGYPKGNMEIPPGGAFDLEIEVLS